MRQLREGCEKMIGTELSKKGYPKVDRHDTNRENR